MDRPEPNPCPRCDRVPSVYDEIYSETVSVQFPACALTSGQHASEQDAVNAWNMEPMEIE